MSVTSTVLNVVHSNLFGPNETFVENVNRITVTRKLPDPARTKRERTALTINSRRRRDLMRKCKSFQSEIAQLEMRPKRSPSVEKELASQKEVYSELKRTIRNSAAVTIQSAWRGYCIRRPLSSLAFHARSRLQAILKEIARERTEAGRSLPFDSMSYDQLVSEKRSIKAALTRAESHLGQRRGQKEVYRPIYQLYFRVRALVQSHPRYEDTARTKKKKPVRAAGAAEGPDVTKTAGATSDAKAKVIVSSTLPNSGGSNSGSTGSKPVNAALTQLREEKRVLQIKLNEFERDFLKRNGRKIQYRQDIASVRPDYERYKQVKQLLANAEGAS